MASDDSTMGDRTGADAGEPHEELALLWLVPERRVVRLSTARALTCGREANCDIVLAGPSTSREHARIEKDGPIWIVRDLESKNGVWLNGQRVQSGVLDADTVVRIGDGVAVVVRQTADDAPGFSELAPGLFGGARLAAVARRARLASQSDLHLVLEAESGSGKERFARAIHLWSGRAGAFVPLNCAALPGNLAEAELFGYLRGAFTGAERNHDGYFRAAADGTLLLDEVLELSPSLQAKLLRAVEERAVVPLGATKAVPVATRIVAACQSPLGEEVARGRMRADLFARLNGVTLRLPPLRQRREDIFPLFLQFLRRAGGSAESLGPAAIEALVLHDWPLNVRELESVAQRLLVLHPGEVGLSAKQLLALIGRPAQQRASDAGASNDDALWEGLLRALRAQNGNVLRAAEVVGISRQRAYRILARHPEFDVSSMRRS